MMKPLHNLASAVLLFALATGQGSMADELPQISIIIDDLGYELTNGLRVTQLPGPVACAVLPGTPRAHLLATAANEMGKEVLLHLPLQAMDYDGEPEPGAIFLETSRGQFSTIFESDISSIPFVSGVNTHRGSLLTQHPGHMKWLMEEIAARAGLIFVDSYTTHHSVALELARESGIPAVKRDVFLDPDRSAATVAREFERLKSLALQHGAAVAIAHPYPATLELLERELPLLEQQGFALVSLRELMADELAAVAATTTSP